MELPRASDVNMDVAYDKLQLQRPASEPTANLGTFGDQPMLDLMTQKAIAVLSGGLIQGPFISHGGRRLHRQAVSPEPGRGAPYGTPSSSIRRWGVARAWAAKRQTKDTLVVVTADHDQSMHIIGVSNTPDGEYFDRGKSQKVSYSDRPGQPGLHRLGRLLLERPARACRSSTRARRRQTMAASPGMPGTFCGHQSGRQPRRQHLLHLLRFAGLHPGLEDRLSGQLRRRSAPPRRGLPHRRPHRLKRPGDCGGAGSVSVHRVHGRVRHLLQDGGCDLHRQRATPTRCWTSLSTAASFRRRSASSMRLTSSIAGALLAAAPLFCQSPSAAEPRLEKGALVWFDLTETRERGGGGARWTPEPWPASSEAISKPGQYRIGEIDHDEVLAPVRVPENPKQR